MNSELSLHNRGATMIRTDLTQLRIPDHTTYAGPRLTYINLPSDPLNKNGFAPPENTVHHQSSPLPRGYMLFPPSLHSQCASSHSRNRIAKLELEDGLWRCWLWSFMISLRIVSALYMILWSFNVDIKNVVKDLLRKRTLIIAKAIPWIPESAFLRYLNFISVKSCWVLLYSGFVDPCCRWASWAGLFWTVLHDGCSIRWWQVNAWPLGRAV